MLVVTEQGGDFCPLQEIPYSVNQHVVHARMPVRTTELA